MNTMKSCCCCFAVVIDGTSGILTAQRSFDFDRPGAEAVSTNGPTTTVGYRVESDWTTSVAAISPLKTRIAVKTTSTVVSAAVPDRITRETRPSKTSGARTVLDATSLNCSATLPHDVDEVTLLVRPACTAVKDFNEVVGDCCLARRDSGFCFAAAPETEVSVRTKTYASIMAYFELILDADIFNIVKIIFPEGSAVFTFT